MGAALITSATGGFGSAGAGAILTQVADAFLKSKRNKGRILQHVNTDVEQGIVQPHGTARFLLAPSNLTVADETDGTTPNLDDTVAVPYDVPISEHKTILFGYTQVAQALANSGAIPAQLDGRMTSLFNTIEEDICGLAASFSTTVLGTPGTGITQLVYNAARAAIVTNQAPANDMLTAFFAPGAKNWDAFTGLSDVKDYRIRGVPSPVMDKDFAHDNPGLYFRNAMNYESQNVKAGNLSGTAFAYNFMFHRDAILVALKTLPLPEAGIGVVGANFKDPESGIEFQILKYWDQAHGGTVVKIHSLYGRALGREEWGALMEA